MRLTLRTLLAYLDNTLEPEDAKLLREKLEESGFATQLVQRIRDSLSNDELTAPPPESVHPIGEANVISEYLDSTLTPEQIAEIERACLESEPHLAEAAACHQILTMVLGKPAEVSDQLRQRVYMLADAASSQPPKGSFSSVSIPSDGAPLLPTADSDLRPAGKTVQPVGPDDSGVSDAPTRLRESGAADDEPLSAVEPAMAGSRRRGRLEVSDVYSGTVRPSRITPWLVTLALAGVLAFVLMQIFQPILRQKAAQNDTSKERVPLSAKAPLNADDNGAAASAEEPAEEPTEPATESDPAEEADSSEEPQEPREADATPEKAATPDADSAKAVETPADDDAGPDPIPSKSGDDGKPDAPPAEDADPSIEEVQEALEMKEPDPVMAPTVDADSAAEGPDPIPMETKDTAAPDAPPTGEQAKGPANPDAAAQAKPDAAAPAAATDALATLTTENTVLVAQVEGNNWVRIGKDNGVGEQVKMVNAPGFRSQLTTAGGQMTLALISATQATLAKNASGGDVPGVNVEFGRILITAKEAGASTIASFGGYEMTITMAEPETVVAAEVRYLRQPGQDPTNPENHLRVARVFSLQGDVELKTADGDHKLQTGQRWLLRGDEISPIDSLTATPSWVDPPEQDGASIESEARQGLVQLLADADALTIYLSEATTFRRAEVGALAAQTLLAMGNGSIYFGGDGVLSNPKQRAYWPAHFLALKSVVDHSPESTAAISRSITEMDAADGNTLFRLLVGYSEKQLVEGGDEELVELLESNSMAVRVLAIENLRSITGTTLYYRAEEDSAVRRAQATKKWRTRQRKGDIRWNADEE